MIDNAKDTDDILDLNNSVPSRDFDLERDFFRVKRADFIAKYIRRLERIASVPDYVEDNTYHGIHSSHHIVFKCVRNGETVLRSKDGNREYEFIIEFDRNRPEYGIYYGCRGLILGGSQAEEILRFDSEWSALKDEICRVLNNTFPGKDFTKRYQFSDNANNKTYWPFYFTLGEDEEIVDVAVRATRLLRNIYEVFIDSDRVPEPCVMEIDDRGYIGTQTAYTNESFENTCQYVKSKFGASGLDDFKGMISMAEKAGMIVRDRRYECCWKVVSAQNVEVALFVAALSWAVGWCGKTGGSIPWVVFTNNFLSSRDDSFESIRKSYNRSGDTGVYKERVRSAKQQVGLFLKGSNIDFDMSRVGD